MSHCIVQSESPLNQQCLRDLRVTDPYADKARIQSASGGLLKESYRWILENEEFKRWQDNEGSLLWIKGDPGKGKTMLLCGIIDELSKSAAADSIISFFFCQATDVRINSATAVLRGLIYSLVLKRPSLLSHVRTEYDQAGKQLFEDVNAWHALANILSGILKDLSNTYLVIDALDECMIGLSPLLDFISQQPTLNSGVRWIVSSRNWPEINERLRDTAGITPISLELNEACISEAVKGFIQYRAAELAKLKKYDAETRDKIDAYLLENSQNTFLWVSLVCQELSRYPVWQAVQRLNDLPPGLNALYDRMMNKIHMSGDAELCRRILAAMSIVHRPITLAELQYCVDLPEAFADNSEAASDMIAFCGSFLTLQNNIIVFVHNSAKDFIFSRAFFAIFPSGVEAEHHQIFRRCFKTISNILRRDIFDIKSPSIPVKLVSKPNPSPLAAVEYACVYWAEHLQQCSENIIRNGDFEESGIIDKFLQQSYLHWIEALSLLGSTSEGIVAMLKLDSLLQVGLGSLRSGERQTFLITVIETKQVPEIGRSCLRCFTIFPVLQGCNRVYPSTGLLFSLDFQPGLQHDQKVLPERIPPVGIYDWKS